MNNPSKRFQPIFSVLCMMFCTMAQAGNFTLESIPLLTPQPDGVVYLNAEAAGFVRPDKRLGPHVFNGMKTGYLRVVEGRITGWYGDREMPVWRFQPPKPGSYRVVLNVATGKHDECHSWISFRQGKRESRVTFTIPASKLDEPMRTLEGGVVKLESEPIEAYYIPRGWRDPRNLADLLDVRLIPLNSQAATTTVYPKVRFPTLPVDAPDRSALFPTGQLDQLPEMSLPSGKAPITLAIIPPAGAEARKAAFARRNSPEGLEPLCRRLHAAIRPSTPGLETFEEDFRLGRYAKALEDYRHFFFDRLKRPEAYGASDNNLLVDFFIPNGKSVVARKPSSYALKCNLEGIVAANINGNLVEARVGPPGGVNWAPASLRPPEGADFGRSGNAHPFWKTPEGQRMGLEINFYRMLNTLPGDNDLRSLFPSLLYSYMTSGNVQHLTLYSAYMDDWCMNSREDLANCPVNIRAATELEVNPWFVMLLRVILDERPSFAQDLPAPTLARIMLSMIENYHPYVIRAKRAELANWGIMGVERSLHLTFLFREFEAMNYFNREMVRLARINFIQHLSLEGENLEAWGEGHNNIDPGLLAARDYSLQGAPVMGDFERQTLRDHITLEQRTYLSHITPEGNYWPEWATESNPAKTSLTGRYFKLGLLAGLMDEPEAVGRLQGILTSVPPPGLGPTSEIRPYGSMVLMRDRWGREGTMLVLQNFPFRSQTQATVNGKEGPLGSPRTQYAVSRGGRGLLDASPIVVDGNPPNRWVDLVPTGGKTDYCGQTPRHVMPVRFHTSDRFDITEAPQDAPYRSLGYDHARDIYGLGAGTNTAAIRDVKALRRVIHVRGEGLFLIGDRIDNGATEREFSQFFALPVRMEAKGQQDRLRTLAEKNTTLVEIDPAKHSIRTANIGFENVSVFLAGHTFQWGGKMRDAHQFDTVSSITAESLLKSIAKNRFPDRAFSERAINPVSVRWHGAGPQALVTTVYTRPSESRPEGQFDNDLVSFAEINGENGVAGCTLKTRSGVSIWFQSGPQLSQPLRAGPAKATAGALMVMERNGEWSGVVLDARTLSLNGKTYACPSDAFEFILTKAGVLTSTPIVTPIDTVSVLPQQTVFTDPITVSFDIPTQDSRDIVFHYTLDGTDPTPESPLYTGPFVLKDNALVKVRPFRASWLKIVGKQAAKTLWNTPGINGGKTVSATFYKQAPLPAIPAANVTPGLRYRYFEDHWPTLMAHSGMQDVLPVKASGLATALLDEQQLKATRTTDRAFALKYDGFMEVPATGVYRVFAPEPLYNTTLDAGYDLRVWVDGREWFPNPDLHAENIWSVALEKGLHRLQVSYVDFRWKHFRNEYLMTWRPEQMWHGTPKLEIDGPNITRRPIPDPWLKHSPVSTAQEP